MPNIRTGNKRARRKRYGHRVHFKVGFRAYRCLWTDFKGDWGRYHAQRGYRVYP